MLAALPLPPKRKKPPRPPSENATEGFYGPRWLWKTVKLIAHATGRSASELAVGWMLQGLAEYAVERGALRSGQDLDNAAVDRLQALLLEDIERLNLRG